MLALSGIAFTASQAPASAAPNRCGLPETGPLTPQDVLAGMSVIDCSLVGRVILFGDGGITVPPPGMAVGSEALRADGQDGGFQVSVAKDGTISYPTGTTVEPSVTPMADTRPCYDGAYNTNDLKEYGTYNWWIGDGGMPGGLSRSAAKKAFADAINNITGSYNNCGYSDQVDAHSHYSGRTSYEADINSHNVCTKRDGKSTWDAGNLKNGTVARTCWWSWPEWGIKNDLREADTRFNTHDYDFTNHPHNGHCHNSKYDIRSVGTHEAGHVFGMGHVSTSHPRLTMTTNSHLCESGARTLGKGDVRGLRSIY